MRAWRTAGVLAATWLAGCGRTGDAVGAAVAPGPPPPNARIRVWSWNIAAKALQRIVPDFNARHPGIRVEVDMTGANLQSRFLLSLAAGVGAPDVSQLQFTDAAKYVATGRLADLTPVAAKHARSFPRSRWEGCTLSGRVYAIPWDIGPCAVYYKRDLFARYGVDPESIETWDDYVEAGRRIVAASGGRTRMLPLASGSLAAFFELLIQQTGGQVFDGEGRVAIDSPECREALEVLRRLMAAGICHRVTWWSQEFMAGLKDDTVATYPLAVWFGGTIKDTVQDFAGKGHQWGVFRLPAIRPGGLRTSNLGGSVLVIPAQSRQREAAWAFVEHALCTVEGQIAQYRAMDLFPAYLPALEDPYVDSPDPFFGGQRAGRLFATDVTRIPPLHRTADWAEAARYLDQALTKWAADGMRDPQILDRLARKLARRLGRERRRA